MYTRPCNFHIDRRSQATIYVTVTPQLMPTVDAIFCFVKRRDSAVALCSTLLHWVGAMREERIHIPPRMLDNVLVCRNQPGSGSSDGSFGDQFDPLDWLNNPAGNGTSTSKSLCVSTGIHRPVTVLSPT